MNNTIEKSRRFDLWYLVGTMAIALLLYTGLKWYQEPVQEPIPQTRSKNIEQAQEFFVQGNSFYHDGNYQEALQQYQRAVAVNPQHHQAHTLMSMILMRNGNYNHAIEHAQKAVAANRNYIPGHVALGQAHERNNNFTDAKKAYHQAISINDINAEPHILLSKLYVREMTAESCTRAITHAQKALALEPDNNEAFFALGDAQLTAGKPGLARESYAKINKLNDQYRKLLCLGQTYERERNFTQAQNYYKQAIATNNNLPQGHILLAGTQFALSNLAEGFKEYEYRWQVSNMNNLQNKWDGSSLKDKRILILAENGLGDILQYVRFAQTAKERGAYVIVNSPKALLELFKQVDYIDEVIEIGTVAPEYDVLTSMQSIPALVGTTLNTLPNKPYLVADQKLVDQWKTKLSKDTNFKIGLCWQPGDDSYMGLDQKRSLTLELLKPLAQQGVSFYCLQKGGTTAEQLKNAPFKINSFDDTFDLVPFMDTAAVMKNMDLVISVDTSVAHLASALGVKTWILLPYSSDVRWMIDRSDCPWYPTATLFRQATPGNWNQVIKSVSTQLNTKLSTRA